MQGAAPRADRFSDAVVGNGFRQRYNHAVPTDRVSARMAPAFLCRLLCACAIPKCAMLSLGFSQRD